MLSMRHRKDWLEVRNRSILYNQSLFLTVLGKVILFHNGRRAYVLQVRNFAKLL